MPLPDGPTTAISGATARRATSSATSRSRPKNISASSTSNDASPLNGQATMRAPAVRVAWSSSTPPATLVLGRTQPGPLDFNPLFYCVQLVRHAAFGWAGWADVGHLAVLVGFALVMWRAAIIFLECRLID